MDDPFGLDMGKCIFCKECHFACPQKIMFTNDYKIAASNREDLVIRVGQTKMDFDHSAVRPVIRKLFKQSLKLRQISAAGDNSSEMELNASGNVNFDMGGVTALNFLPHRATPTESLSQGPYPKIWPMHYRYATMQYQSQNYNPCG